MGDRKIRFMAMVSHELRSPLHGIIGLTNHLLSSEENETKLRFLNLVTSCVTRLLDLVTNIMDIASLTSKDSVGKPKNQVKLARDPVDLTKILNETVLLV